VDDAFREFAEQRLDALVRFGWALTGSRDAAHDLVQTALTRTALAWPRVQRKDNPEAYVRQTMVRTQINTWRGRRPVADVDVSELTIIDATDHATVDAERDSVWRALATLPARQRAVVVLRFYEDRSEAEIADLLGCSRGTVKSQCAKALVKLRPLLTNDDREEVPL